MLTVQNIHQYYGGSHILRDVSLSAAQGRVTVLLGRNGVGKTTTLRTLMGLWQASRGRIVFEGKDITHYPTPDIARLGIAYVPENMGIFADLSVAENLLLAARAAPSLGALPRERVDWIFELFPAMKTFWQHPAGKLSGGQKQMLAVSRAIIEPRRLLVVDEPSKGLAPAIIDNMIQAFAALKAQGVTVLLVEQNLNFARQLGDHVVVMDNGQVVHQGAMGAFMADESLQQSLLGLAL